jgi:lipopolysaccharide transport system ATP-binding protein
MSSNDVAVAVRALSKSYTIAHNANKYTTLGEAFAHRIKNPLQRVEKETFWALQDVDFDIKKGDVVGIVGHNGAGKSTLLKILSQITQPTSGEIRLYGRVGSLLEVGTGFHPELTGRENIYLNGAILGMRRGEIDHQFDAIVDFAEVEQFLDTPVKRYSSGMYVRLAFAVAAHLNPEILLVDEVLAVGDAAFQRKCLGKMKDVATSGRTVLLVTHNMSVVQQLCRTAIFLSKGRLNAVGNADVIVAQYSANPTNDVQSSIPRAPNNYGLYMTRCEFIDSDLQTTCTTLQFGRPYKLFVGIGVSKPFRSAGVSILIRDHLGSIISSCCPAAEYLGFIDIEDELLLNIEFDEIALFPGNFTVDVIVNGPYDSTKYLEAESAIRFAVEPWCLPGAARFYENHHGYARLHSRVKLEKK